MTLGIDDKIHVKEVLEVLEVFGKITSRGTKTDDGVIFNGITAKSDFDGYTITLCNDYVSLTVFFHNKFTFEYSSAKERDLFLDKMTAIKKAS